MPVKYVDVDEAIAASGLRMMVVSNVPSPWGEAAKGIFHVKGLDWKAVRLAYDDPKLAEWAGELSAPVAVYGDEPPRSRWSDILLLAERLQPEPSLIPDDPSDRALMFGWAHELLGEEGLGWSRRLQAVESGFAGQGGFRKPVAQYLAGKYGYNASLGATYGGRVRQLLNGLSDRLKAQKAAGSHFYIGDMLSALDIYSATTLALFAPLPEDICQMNPDSRAAFLSMDDETRAALDPVLLEHRDRMYADVLETPLSL